MDCCATSFGHHCVSTESGMIKRFLFLCFSFFLGLGLMACSEQPTELEAPVALQAPDDATGYYCGMLLPEHEGPKGQIHLASRERPIWFTSVHDTIVFTRLPEEPRDITAAYVHDMGQGNDWDNPRDLWVEAQEAWFVINSEDRKSVVEEKRVKQGGGRAI